MNEIPFCKKRKGEKKRNKTCDKCRAQLRFCESAARQIRTGGWLTDWFAGQRMDVESCAALAPEGNYYSFRTLAIQGNHIREKCDKTLIIINENERFNNPL